MLSSSQRTHCLLYYMLVARQFIRLKPILHRKQYLSQLQKLIFLQKHCLLENSQLDIRACHEEVV